MRAGTLVGNVGRALAAKATALRFRILVHSRRREGVAAPFQWAPLETLLAESDYVSLHLPSTPETRHLIVTPHAAFYSQEAVSDLRRRVARQVADVLSGKMPESVSVCQN